MQICSLYLSYQLQQSMKYIEFIQRIEGLKGRLHGHGKELASLCDLSIEKYYSVVNGRVRNPDTLAKVLRIAESFLEEKLNNENQLQKVG